MDVGVDGKKVDNENGNYKSSELQNGDIPPGNK